MFSLSRIFLSYTSTKYSPYKHICVQNTSETAYNMTKNIYTLRGSLIQLKKINTFLFQVRCAGNWEIPIYNRPSNARLLYRLILFDTCTIFKMNTLKRCFHIQIANNIHPEDECFINRRKIINSKISQFLLNPLILHRQTKI